MTEVPAYVVLGGTGGIGSELTRLLTSLGNHVLGRLGEPRDVASAIQGLLDPGQGWVTGQVVGVDGGLSSARTMPRA